MAAPLDVARANAASIPVIAAPGARALPSRRGDLARVISIGAALALVLVAGAILVPVAQEADFMAKNLPPSIGHPFGTDWMGRDMLCRTIAGLSISASLGLGAALAAAGVSLVLGCVAALGGPKADAMVSGAIDVVMGLPHIVLLILVSFAFGKGFTGVVGAIALTEWPRLARVVRAEMLQCRESDYVMAARKLGQGPVKVATHHLVPYVLPQFAVGLVLLFPHAILHEASLTFLGFGLPPEAPAIGSILSESMGYLVGGEWWLVLWPGLSLVLCVLGFDMLGRSLARLLIRGDGL